MFLVTRAGVEGKVRIICVGMARVLQTEETSSRGGEETLTGKVQQTGPVETPPTLVLSQRSLEGANAGERSRNA